MRAMKPKPFTLQDFVSSRRIWTGVPQWHQILDWHRAGYVSIRPVETMASEPDSRCYADVLLTEKWRPTRT